MRPRRIDAAITTVLMIVAIAALITCFTIIRCNRILVRQRMSNPVLQWVALVEDVHGTEIGVMYRWKELDMCILAGYHSIEDMPCPSPPMKAQ